LWLIDLRAGVAYRANVAWRRPPELGLRFLDEIDPKQPIAGAFAQIGGPIAVDPIGN
jgi:hypothetical protein